MRRLPEPSNPWGLLCTFPGWRGLRETLQDLEQMLRTIGGDAAELAATVAAVLDDPVSARADLPANYRLHLSLQKGRLPEHLDLESEVPGWVSQVAYSVCDVPTLLAAADGLGPALTAELPRALQGRFADLVGRLRQMLQGRKLKAPGPFDAQPEPAAREGGLRRVVPQADGYSVLLPLGAGAAEHRAAWRELAYLLLACEGPDVARLHLQLLAAWPGELSREQVQAALGLRRAAPERCYEAIRRLQRLRLSLYQWELDGGALTLEHQAQELWTLRLREGGQAQLVQEAGGLVARGQEWWITPGPHSWAAATPAEAVEREQARLLLEGLEGSRNLLSLALGLALALSTTSLTNRDVLTLAGVDVTDPQPELWPRVRSAARLQQRAGWTPDLGQWGKRSGDWEQFLAAETSFSKSESAPAE